MILHYTYCRNNIRMDNKMCNENKKEQNPAPEVSDNNLEGVVGGNRVNDNRNVTLYSPDPPDPNKPTVCPLPSDIMEPKMY